MPNEIERAIIASTVCLCKHERKYHDPCSLCYCPGYIPSKSHPSYRDWKRDLNARRAAEAR